MDLGLALAGLFVGVVVGLTGMGGGALMTPVLVLFFGIQPLAAVSSDLVTSAFMKPVGSWVHLRIGTVDLRMAGLLMLGSVPSAFAGVFVLRAFGDGEAVQNGVQRALGIALLVAAGSLAYKAYLAMRERAERHRTGRDAETPTGAPDVTLRPVATVLVGVVGGLVVGMTSVGSGSLIIIALLALYPALSANQLVGTDLVQAVPLVASAALGHYFFGDFHLSVAASLLVGAVPGCYLGARWSSRAPGGVIRRALALVLVASALKLLGVPTAALGVVLVVAVLAGPFLWGALRRAHGLPAFGPARGADSPSAGAELETAPPTDEPEHVHTSS